MTTATTKGTAVDGTVVAVNASLSSSPPRELLQEPPKPKAETVTFKYQQKLPKLPIPPLADTCRRYLNAVKPLQVPEFFTLFCVVSSQARRARVGIGRGGRVATVLRTR